jgi:ankyrin repeat protein
LWCGSRTGPQDQRTVLHGASVNGHVTVVRVLLQNGADAAAKDKARCAHVLTHAAMVVVCAHMRCCARQDGNTPLAMAKDDNTREALATVAAAAEALAGLSLSGAAPGAAALAEAQEEENEGEEEEEEAADAPKQGRIRGLISRAKKVVLG